MATTGLWREGVTLQSSDERGHVALQEAPIRCGGRGRPVPETLLRH